MVLNSGTVYASFLHDHYSAPSTAASRALVDRLMNGEDVLFNFVVANTTGQPPLIIESVEATSRVQEDGQQQSLSRRDTHFVDRSMLFNTFAQTFNAHHVDESQWNKHTIPPYAVINPGDTQEQLVLPPYTTVVTQAHLQSVTSAKDLVSKDALPSGSVLYEFSATGSTMRQPGGSLYSTVQSHEVVDAHLKRLRLTAAEPLAHWMVVPRNP